MADIKGSHNAFTSKKCTFAVTCFALTSVIVLALQLGFLSCMPIRVQLCSKANRSETLSSIRLYVGVISKAANYEKRMTIRKTWGSDAGLQRVVFVVANPSNNITLLNSLRQEATEHKDLILVGHVQEHYFNITHQTLEVFRSAYAYHKPVTHVMKCDDDSYLHVSRLLTLLVSHPGNRTLFGHVNTRYNPDRNPGGKWYVSKEDWPEDSSELLWTNGPGYILTKDLADELAVGAAYSCSPNGLLKLEDIALGSWLRCLQNTNNVAVDAVHTPFINLAGCSEGDLVSHYMSPKQMVCMFASAGVCC